jgi:YYY domain-containing protein
MAVNSTPESSSEEKEVSATPYQNLQRLLTAFQPLQVALALGFILILGAFFRFQSIDWDSGQHLHPDERFLTMVATGIEWPRSLSEYFDSDRSSLNPYNHGFGTYVYGTFPLFLTKWIAQLANLASYQGLHLVGRALSGLMDLISIVLLFLIGRQLYDARTGLLAAALLAFSVFNIQQSHFFTVDMPANLMVVIAMWFALRVARGGEWINFIGLGLAFGLAIASKINLALFGVLILVAFVFRDLRAVLARAEPQRPADSQVPKEIGDCAENNIIQESPAHLSDEHHLPLNLRILWQPVLRLVLGLLSVLFAALIVFRIAQPYAFAGPSFFSLQLSPKWTEDMAATSRLVSGQVDYPPGDQWVFRTPYLFPWLNMVRWGMGWALGLSAWIGLGLAAWELVARKKSEHLLPVVWILVLFFDLGGGFVLTMRYFLPIYPFLILMAAYFLIWLWDRAKGWEGQAIRADIRPWRPALMYLARAFIAGVVAVTFLWALAFTAIYRQPVSRVTASRWIYANVPPGTTYGWEHWDDPLPLRVDGKDASSLYKAVELPLYAEDTPEKLYGDPNMPGSGLLDKLDQVDWIFVSSARLYSSIPRLPMRYPMTVKYYQALFDGELGFERVKTFNVFPNLFGWEINDQAAEEQFTVYDHPQVILFRKTPVYSRERAEKLLGNVDWESIQRLTPFVATQTQNGLMLTPAERQAQQAGGTWSQMFNRAALSNLNDFAAVLTWLLSLELLSIAALPITVLVFHGLRDRGYLFAKPLGLLLVSYLSWMAASVTPLSYSRTTILAALALVGIVGGLIWSLQPALAEFLKNHRRLILFEELIFLIFLIGFILIRRANPDLWRPWTGGEKPMDFAYLNAVLKSTRFPPYDPWFAGGYMNYYYFGFVEIASLIKLTGIVPWIAYNLAVPALFAMTAAGGFSVVFNLVQFEQPKSVYRAAAFGLCGVLFVTVLGNLGEFKLIYSTLRELGSPSTPTAFSWLDGLHEATTGLSLWLHGSSLPVRLEWWYWNATRVMPGIEIEEFPFFTFLFADLHAHMMALPITLLAIAGTVNFLGMSDPQIIPTSFRNVRAFAPLLSLGILALIIGALRAVNTWDYPTYLIIGFSAFGVWSLQWRRGWDVSGSWIGAVIFIVVLRFVFGLGPEISLMLGILIGGMYGLVAGCQAVLASALLAFASLLFFFPFNHSYANAYSSLELWHGARTSMADYLTIHGLFFFILATYLVIEWNNQLKIGSSSGSSTEQVHTSILARGIKNRMGYVFLLILILAALSGLAIFVLRLPVVGIALPLAVLAGLLLLQPGLERTRHFVVLLILAGLLLTLLVEILVVKGDVGRSNTVFKIFLQVWVIWSIAAATSLPYILTALRRGFWAVRWLWIAGFSALIVAAALYPIFATPAHVRDRIDPSAPATLNGMVFMQRAVYIENAYTGQPVAIDLKYDLDALTWMQDHLVGSPVIAEANNPNLYHWTARVSIWTGLPSLLGYNWHEKQQRAILGGELIDEREQQANQLFLTESSTEALAIIRRFGVGYIYIGPVEGAFYPRKGIEKFEQLVGTSLEVAYENPKVRIYRVLPAK